MARRTSKLLYVALYGAFASLGAALLARPAALFVHDLGLSGPVVPRSGPLGWPSAVLLLGLAAFTVALAVSSALGRRPRPGAHAAFLGLVAAALVVRAAGGEQSGADPEPALREALRAAASAVDASYAGGGRYDPGASRVQAVLDALPPSPFRHRAKPVRYTVRILQNASAAQRTALPGDLPATLYVAIARGGQGGWLSIATLRGGEVAILPAIVEARAGTHSEPGESLLVPRYPGARPAPR